MTPLFRRLYAILIRQLYLIRRSPPRVLSIMFWPSLQMTIWGFLNSYLFSHANLVNFTLSTLLGATLLSCFFERSNINTMFAFLEDVWARNLGNVLITPLRPMEMLAGYILNGFCNVLIGVGTACILGFFIFDYSLFKIGMALVPFILNLILSGWCVGLMLVCVIIRFGTSGEHFGWMLAFLFTPFIAIYYPVSILPQAMQYVSWALPPTYVFESLRELLATGAINWNAMYKALALNLMYLTLVSVTFVYQLNKARVRGGLLSMSE